MLLAQAYNQVILVNLDDQKTSLGYITRSLGLGLSIHEYIKTIDIHTSKSSTSSRFHPKYRISSKGSIGLLSQSNSSFALMWNRYFLVLHNNNIRKRNYGMNTMQSVWQTIQRLAGNGIPRIVTQNCKMLRNRHPQRSNIVTVQRKIWQIKTYTTNINTTKQIKKENKSLEIYF